MAREQPIVAWDFLGLGEMGDSTESNDASGKHHALHDADPSTFLGLRKSGMRSKPHESTVGGIVGPAAASMNGSILFNSMAFAGMKHPVWSKAASMQHLLPLRNLHEERFVEQSAESVPERSVPPLVHPLQMQDLVNNNQRNALCTQAWRHGDSVVNFPTQACEDRGPSAHFSGGFTRMPSSGLTDRQVSAPLTICYGGNVSVFNSVSAEKAEAIMFLAGGGNGQCSAGAELLTAAMATTNPRDKSHINTPPAPSSPLQPVVPRALPQARKASLARFLEKRRERVQLKSPYSLNQEDSSLPEERFSSSNDVASYKPCGNVDHKKRVPMSSWMERMSEYYACDMDVKEELNVIAT